MLSINVTNREEVELCDHLTFNPLAGAFVMGDPVNFCDFSLYNKQVSVKEQVLEYFTDVCLHLLLMTV